MLQKQLIRKQTYKFRYGVSNCHLFYSSDGTTPSDLTDKPIVWSLINANGKRDCLVKNHLGVVEIRREIARSVLRTK
jgi:hypothetical protein